MSLVAQLDKDGETVKSMLDAETFPVHVALVSGLEGGWATLYPAEGSESFVTSNATGGTLEILRVDGGEDLVGCFEFVAGSDAGDTVTVDGGSMRATPTTLPTSL
jgi:hypothetical protein